MKPWILGSVSAAALMTTAGAGWALTAQEALDAWRNAAGEFGIRLEDDGETTSGGTLSVKGLRYVVQLGLVSVTADVGDVTLSENPDGTVAATYADTSSLVIAGEKGTESFRAQIGMAHPGLAAEISEAGGEFTSRYVMPRLEVKLDEAVANGKPVDASLDYTFEDMSYASVYSPNSAPSFRGETMVGRSAGSYAYSLPELGQSESNEVTLTGIRSSAELNLGDVRTLLTGDLSGASDAEMMDLVGKILDSGFTVSGNSSYDTYTVTSISTEEFGKVSIDATAGPAQNAFALAADGAEGSGAISDLKGIVTVQGEMPLPPIAFELASGEATVAMPFKAGEGDVSYRVALNGLSLDESIWSMVDPAAVLPRDPATVVLDFTGRVTWLHDLFSAATANADPATPPIQIDALDINALQLSVGGADLTGDGAFTFDNTDTTSFNGMPRPEGKANLRLQGGNGLLDKLTQMGLVPQDQVMMVRMMAGMFAKPGTGPDELLSEIVIDDAGRILINGAPLPGQ